jgi:integrase
MAQINRLKPMAITKQKEPGRYGDGGGLYLRVAAYETKSGPAISKNWIFRFERDGRERLMGLGSLNTLSLADARLEAQECRKCLLQGLDPIDMRNQRKMAAKLEAARRISFERCADRYIAEHRKGWKSAVHARQWETTLKTYAYPSIGKMTIGDIDTEAVLKCLKPIWQKIPDTARRTRGRIEKILDWATAHEYRTGDNPARLSGHIANLLAKVSKTDRVKHHPALPFEELPVFMIDLRAKADISARALEFLILTAARTTETILATGQEVDFEKKLWTVPAARMKSKRDHVVPLCDRAIEILQTTPRDKSGHLFPGARAGRPLSNMAMLELLRGMRGGCVVHGFRSTFRDWAGDRTNHSRDVVEAALAHVIKDETEAAYRRGTALDKRKVLMADWEAYCRTRPAGDNVLPLRSAR